MMQVLQGDCLERMKELPAGSINTCVTSPPYFGLRDYGRDGQIGLEDTPEASGTWLEAINSGYLPMEAFNDIASEEGAAGNLLIDLIVEEGQIKVLHNDQTTAAPLREVLVEAGSPTSNTFFASDPGVQQACTTWRQQFDRQRDFSDPLDML